MWKSLLKAARFARKAHAGQKRAHGAPYFEHPVAVARRLWSAGHRNPALLAAAYCHDTMEDCGTTYSTLAANFGTEAANLVAAVTKSESESYASYYAKVKAAGSLAMTLKLADREANGADLAKLPANHPLVTQYPGKLREMLTAFTERGNHE